MKLTIKDAHRMPQGHLHNLISLCEQYMQGGLSTKNVLTVKLKKPEERAYLLMRTQSEVTARPV